MLILWVCTDAWSPWQSSKTFRRKIMEELVIMNVKRGENQSVKEGQVEGKPSPIIWKEVSFRF